MSTVSKMEIVHIPIVSVRQGQADDVRSIEVIYRHDTKRVRDVRKGVAVGFGSSD